MRAVPSESIAPFTVKLIVVPDAAKMPANYVWLDLHTFQHSIMVIFEKFFFFVGLNLVRKYALNVSWRKQVLAGSLLVLVFNSLYFIIIFDVWRNSWFYIFTDVSALFMYTLNFLASHACIGKYWYKSFDFWLSFSSSHR